MQNAFAAWSVVANIQFQEVTETGTPLDANGIPAGGQVVGVIRIGAHAFDGASGTLAHAYFPKTDGSEDPGDTTITGDMHFDTAENWSCSPGAGVIDIGIVTIHEIGHSIGFSHEENGATAIMNPTYNSSVSDLQTDDINGAVAVYGPSTVPSLTMSKSASPIYAGRPFSYTIVVANNGAVTATNVIITDTVPANTSYVENSASAGGTFDGTTVNWTGLTVLGNESITVTMDVTASNALVLDSIITNTAYVTSAEGIGATDTVTSTVNVAPLIRVSPNSLESEQVPDTVVVKPLTIGNEGSGQLDWEIYEAASPLVALPLIPSIDSSNEVSNLEDHLPPGLLTSSESLPVANPLTTADDDLPLPPEEISALSFILDDGSTETVLGVGGQALWLNRFTPTSFPFTLNEVRIQFSHASVNVGETIDLYIYEDSDSNPSTGATHLASYTGLTVQSIGSFSQYTLSPPVTVNGPGDLLIGFVNRTAGADSGEFPADIDQTSSAGRSWVGIYAGNPPDPPSLPATVLVTIDTAGFPGNLMIRGYGSTGTSLCSANDISWASVSPTTGLVNVGADTTVDVSFNSAGLSDGVYTGTLCIDSNDLLTSRVTVPVTLTVATPPFNLRKSVSASTVVVGDVLTYTLVAKNEGASIVTDVIITDTIPANTSYQEGSASDSGIENNGLISWVTGTDLAQNEMLTRTFVVTVNTNVVSGTVIANKGYLSATNIVTGSESNLVNSTALGADLTLTKSVSSGLIENEGALTYTLVVQNRGVSAASTVVLTDSVPANSAFVTASDSGSESGGMVTWSLGDMNIGATLTRTFVVTVGTNVFSGTVIANTGYVSASNIAAVETSNTVSSTVLGPVLSLSKLVSAATIPSGEVLTYTLVLQNNGSAQANSVVLTDTIPVNSSYQPGSASDSGLE
ncbi:MAG: matrixin family metalloprotease, partial [Chloroflexota bacterium]